MLATCHHIPGTSCLKWPQTVTQDRSPFNSCQTRLWLWTGFSYQKKILERRLAEADGLSFASFRTCSMPTNSKSDLETFPAGCFVRECVSIKSERKETVREQLLSGLSIAPTDIQDRITTARAYCLAVRWTGRRVIPPTCPVIGRLKSPSPLHVVISVQYFLTQSRYLPIL